MGIQEKIEYYRRNKHCIHVERKKDDFTGSSQGYIVDYSEGFLLLQLVNDLRIDGYQIVPIYTINKVRFDRTDKFRDKILEKEGQKESAGISRKIDLTSWVSIFKSIKKTGCFVTVEGEALIKYDIPYVTVGAIKRIEKDNVVIHYVSTYGLLEEPFDKIAYSDITTIQFDNLYLNLYQKYSNKK